MDGGGAVVAGYQAADSDRQPSVKRHQSNYDLHSASRPSHHGHPTSPSSPYGLQHPQSPHRPYPVRGSSLSQSSFRSSMDKNEIPIPSDRYRPRTARSGSTSSHESLTSKVYQPPLRTKRSEPSRLRLLSRQSYSSATDGRKTPEALSPTASLISQQALRPNGTGSKRSESPSQLSPSSVRSRGPVDRGAAALRSPPPFSPSARDRGLSVSSSKTTSTNTSSRALRPSTSIPDYHSAISINSRHRKYHPNTSTYRPGRTPQGHGGTHSPRRREDSLATPDGYSSDEIRASFRSALTTGSSYIGTIGTERSSVLTKSSSVSDLLGIGQHHVEDKDNLFSVDDAIGLYVNGFKDDSAVEDSDVDDEAMANAKEPAPTIASTMEDSDRANHISPSPNALHTSKRSSLIEMETTKVAKSPLNTSLPLRPSSPSSLHDRYGFRKTTLHITLAQHNAWSRSYELHLARRRRKWEILLDSQGLSNTVPTVFPPKNTKIKRFIRKGIPPDWRGAAWFFYAGGPAHIASNPGMYARLQARAEAGEVPEIDSEAIERDLHRTFPDNIHFKPESDLQLTEPIETPILSSLRRVLQAFAIHAPKIGYCQSLNFLAGLLLLLLRESANAEEQAFVLLDIITSKHLPGMPWSDARRSQHRPRRPNALRSRISASGMGYHRIRPLQQLASSPTYSQIFTIRTSPPAHHALSDAMVHDTLSVLAAYRDLPASMGRALSRGLAHTLPHLPCHLPAWRVLSPQAPRRRGDGDLSACAEPAARHDRRQSSPGFVLQTPQRVRPPQPTYCRDETPRAQADLRAGARTC